MYTTVSVGITESQLQSLLAGQKIFLEKSQFQGDVPLPLTKKQATSIASATRGINLKLSSRQISALQSGEGWLSDRFKQVANVVKSGAKALAPVARQGLDMGLDLLQSKIPTQQMGIAKPLGDKAVALARKQINSWADRLQKMLGGAAGIAAIEKQLGAGWFSDYLLPSVETAAKIATPLIGRGGPPSRKDYEYAIDHQMGEGWFNDYFLPGVETAAKIATPFVKGGQFVPDHVMNRHPGGMARIPHMSLGEGFFSSFLAPAMQIAAPLAIRALSGRGWTPMAEMKKNSAAGLVL